MPSTRPDRIANERLHDLQHPYYYMIPSTQTFSDYPPITVYPQHLNGVTPNVFSPTMWLDSHPATDTRKGFPTLQQTEAYLRKKYMIPANRTVDLWALPHDPAEIKGKGLISSVIELAIWGSEAKRLTAMQIYKAVEERYMGISRDSIRHNLSYKSIFLRLDRQPPNTGRGGYYTLDIRLGGQHRPLSRDRKSQEPKKPGASLGYRGKV